MGVQKGPPLKKRLLLKFLKGMTFDSWAIVFKGPDGKVAWMTRWTSWSADRRRQWAEIHMLDFAATVIKEFKICSRRDRIGMSHANKKYRRALARSLLTPESEAEIARLASDIRAMAIISHIHSE